MVKGHIAVCLMGGALIATSAFAQSDRQMPPPAGSKAMKPAETDTTTTNKPVPPAGETTPNAAPEKPRANMDTKPNPRADEDSKAPRNTEAAAPRANGAPVSYITQNRPGLWRASKLEDVDIYNDANEKIGEISEVLLDRDGKVEAVVIGVGGFLGLGERNVAVPFNALQWRTREEGEAPSAAATTTQKAARTAGRKLKDAPERAILPGATKDMLKKAPEFKYAD